MGQFIVSLDKREQKGSVECRFNIFWLHAIIILCTGTADTVSYVMQPCVMFWVLTVCYMLDAYDIKCLVNIRRCRTDAYSHSKTAVRHILTSKMHVKMQYAVFICIDIHSCGIDFWWIMNKIMILPINRFCNIHISIILLSLHW